jgi:hypothetical protein
MIPAQAWWVKSSESMITRISALQRARRKALLDVSPGFVTRRVNVFSLSQVQDKSSPSGNR